jgi:hypothetical protein
MEVIEPGHIYSLDNVDGPINGGIKQYVHFVRRRDPSGELLPLSERQGGILTQELLRVCIDRTLYLYAEAPCDEDTEILDHLRAALCLYESRAARRTIERLARPELAKTCELCGHILCGGHGS